MMCDHEIEVNYYLVREGTPLHQAITGYMEKCGDFARNAERLVAKYNADSAVMQCNPFDTKLFGLNFTDENAPLNRNWKMDAFGHFFPKAETIKKEFDITLPYFRDFFPEAIGGLRFSMLGNKIIIAASPNMDGTVCNVPDADLLDSEAFKELKGPPTERQREHIKQLSRFYWSPFDLLETKAFTPSKEVVELNIERFNFSCGQKTAFKHSPLGRFLGRGLKYLRMHL